MVDTARTLNHPEEAPAVLAREAALRACAGTLRMRDAAVRLGVPEAALLEARRADGRAVRLAAEGAAALDLLDGLGAAGEVMALTRNGSCVHEKTGVYPAPERVGGIAQTLGEIELRIFPRHWATAYALREDGKLSLQVFDSAGQAVHKIWATGATDRAALKALIARFSEPEAPPAIFTARAAPAPETPDAEIDADGLRARWAGLAHSHDFHVMLRETGVSRAQAMRLAGPGFAAPLAAESAHTLLARAADARVGLLIFVGNPGCVQIHSGPVQAVKAVGPWLNVLDPRFNLHLRSDQIAQAWRVKKPSTGGHVHSLELFDEDGFCFAQIFGQRDPSAPERAVWRDLICDLETT